MRLLVVNSCGISCPFYEHEADPPDHGYAADDWWEHSCVYNYYLKTTSPCGGRYLKNYDGTVPDDCPLLTNSVSITAHQ